LRVCVVTWIFLDQPVSAACEMSDVAGLRRRNAVVRLDG
jgi:hypothetical protein